MPFETLHFALRIGIIKSCIPCTGIMASRTIVCIHRMSKQGMRQLFRRWQCSFSTSSRVASADQEGASGPHDQQYNSHFESDASIQEEYDTRERILKASLPFVHQHGWTKNAIAAGAEVEGFPTISHGMFPRGGAELVHFFYSSSNQELATILANRVQTQGEEKPRTRDFIKDAVKTRLRMIVPYLSTWPQAMAIQTLPQNAVESWGNLANVCDEIWYYAGDRSVDFNWYTKRATLAGVYKASEIYLLQDNSDGNVDTWAFLDRRVDDLQNVGKAARNASQLGDVLKEGAWGMCIMGRNMMGMNPRNR